MAETLREDDEPPAPLIWRSLPLRLALVAIPFWLTVPVLISNVDRPIKLVVAIVLGVTLANPGYGLLLVAIFAPLGELIAPLIGARNFRIGEAIVLAFLVGWLLRALPDRRGPRVAAAAAGWLFALTIAASIAGLAWQLGRYPGDLAATVDQIGHIYFFIGDPIGFADGARLLEGLALVAATVTLFRRYPALSITVPIALAASAAAAALSSVLLWRGIGSAAALARQRLISYRVSGHVGDVNAAGSYFAMIVCLALGMAVRERGYRRMIWLGLTGASGVGLWFSESRSALGAAGAVMIVAAMWAATSRFSGRARAMTLAAIVIGLLGGAAVQARMLQADPSYRGVGFRAQFNATSLRMIGARPVLGVGIGQYYRMSPLFLSPQLAWSYGFENAHNYFLQTASELGITGLCLFALCLGAALTMTGRALARAPRDGRLLGTAGGVTAFLATCISGHPFLVNEVAYPFWLQFGLMTALAGSTLLSTESAPNRTAAPNVAQRPWPRLTAAAVVAILAVGSAMTAKEIGPPADSAAIDGLYGWETLPDGRRVRWTGEYASLFVPADVTRAYIPVRLPSNGGTARPMGVEVRTAGIRRGRTLVDDTWAIIDVQLPGIGPPTTFKRIDLKVDRTWQPALYLAGSADTRSVGVQVGELQLLRER